MWTGPWLAVKTGELLQCAWLASEEDGKRMRGRDVSDVELVHRQAQCFWSQETCPCSPVPSLWARLNTKLRGKCKTVGHSTGAAGWAHPLASAVTLWLTQTSKPLLTVPAHLISSASPQEPNSGQRTVEDGTAAFRDSVDDFGMALF